MSGQKWTDNHVAKMRLLYRNGATTPDVAREMRRGRVSVEQKLFNMLGSYAPEAIRAWAMQTTEEAAAEPVVAKQEPGLRPREIELYEGRVIRSFQKELPGHFEGSARVVISLPAF